MFRPSTPFSTPLIIIPTTFTEEYGVPVKNAPDTKNGFQIFASWKTFGGTERTDNGLYSIEDTAQVETWYTNQITSACRVYNCISGAMYEIYGEPEDIDQRHQYLVFKVRRVKGNA